MSKWHDRCLFPATEQPEVVFLLHFSLFSGSESLLGSLQTSNWMFLLNLSQDAGKRKEYVHQQDQSIAPQRHYLISSPIFPLKLNYFFFLGLSNYCCLLFWQPSLLWPSCSWVKMFLTLQKKMIPTVTRDQTRFSLSSLTTSTCQEE